MWGKVKQKLSKAKKKKVFTKFKRKKHIIKFVISYLYVVMSLFFMYTSVYSILR